MALKKKKMAWPLLILLAAALPPALGLSSYFLTAASLILIFIIYASAWNLLAISGQGSLGHAAFFGLGGYVSVILGKCLAIPPLASIFLGALFAAVVGVLIGLTCIRLKEWFLAMVTFGFAVIIHAITTELSFITGGHDGLPASKLVPVSFPGSQLMEYYLLLFFTVLVVSIIYMITKSKPGLAFEAIRENELEANVMGVDIAKYKLSAFAVSAFFTGFAGALEIHHFGYITPDVYAIEVSFWPIIYSISGGLFTIAGPVIGTIVVSVLWQALPLFGLNYERFVLIGLILVATVIFLPKGFVSLPAKLGRRFKP